MTLFRPESLSHRRHKIFGEVILAQPLGFALLTIAFTLSTLAVIFFLLTNQFTRRETAPGWIEPSGGLVVLRPVQAGRIEAMFAAVGDQVAKGDPLFSLNVDVEGVGGKAGLVALETVSEQIAEVTGQIEITRKSFVAEAERLVQENTNTERRLNLLAQEIDTLKQSEQISARRLQKTEKLSEVGHAPKSTVETMRQAWLAEKSRLQARMGAREILLAERQGNQQALKILPNEQERTLSELRQQLQSLSGQKSRASVSSQLLVRAPVSGRVMMVHGEVGQLRAVGQPVASLMPAGTMLEANLLVPPSAIGFLSKGQQVNLMIDAFPYQKFGIQKGRIREISKVSFFPGELKAPFAYETSVYRVAVTLNQQAVDTYDTQSDLLPGMTLSGDLIVDRRTLFEWVFEPLFAAKQRS